VDRRSDVYSLGVTMYRLLTGELPFAGENTVEVLRHTVLHELPPPRQRMPSLPAELEAIILRCVAREPGERYPSARAVAADLRRYLDGEVVEAYAAGLAYRLTRFVLRNKLLVGLAAALYCLIMLEVLADMGQFNDRVSSDPLRLIEAVTSGVAFLAAGMIIFTGGKVRGLTTGASLWLAAAIGLSAGFGFWLMALATTLLALLVIRLVKLGEDRAHGTGSGAGADD